MKAAEEILKEAYEKIELVQDDSPEVIDPILLGMIHEYADQFKPKWISIEHFMPEKETVVIASGGTMYSPRMVILRHGDFEEVGYGFTVYPSHWMPLPENPE